MKKPTFGVIALCSLLLISCQALTRGLQATGEHVEGLGADMVVHAEASEILLEQLETGQITQEKYIMRSKALNEQAAATQTARFKALYSELQEVSKSVKSELALNANAGTGAFVGGLAQGQGLMNAGIAGLMALLGAGGTIAAGRSQKKSEDRSAARAQEIALAATAALAAERNASRLELVEKMKVPA